MANNKSIKEKYVTPKGELVGFISVVKPSTKFNPDGVYKVDILLPKEDGEYLAEKIKAIRTEQFKTFGKGTKVAELTRCVPYTTVNDDGEEVADADGRYILKTNAKAFIENGKPKNKIQLYDAKVQKINSEINIGEGTIAKLILSLEGYSVAGKTGVSVKLKSMQIIKLVGHGETDCASLLTEEDGFEFEEDNTVATEETSEDGETEEDDF